MGEHHFHVKREGLAADGCQSFAPHFFEYHETLGATIQRPSVERFLCSSDFFKDFKTWRSLNIFLWFQVALCQIGFNHADQFASGLKAAFASHFCG